MTTLAFDFATAARIRFGRGGARAGVPEIAAFGRNVLLVHGASAKRSAWMAEALATEGCHVTGFAVDAEPDIDVVDRGCAIARAQKCDVVVALGGGAVLDAGKALAAMIPARSPIMDHLEVVGRGLPLAVPPLPCIAIPTTSGTGAEVTRNAVLTVPEARRKVSLRDPAMLPDLAIVDPSLTDSCPQDVTLASGLDAVTQVIEPYISRRANVLTDALCRAAIPMGLAALRRLVEAPDSTARDEMAWVSLCGGIALANAGLGVVHGLAGPLGGLTSAPHGAVCGILLPHGLMANAAAMQDTADMTKIEDVRHWIATAFDVPVNAAEASLANWSRAQGLPGLDAMGVSDVDRTEAAQMAASSSSMKANPVDLPLEALVEMLEAAR